MPYSMYKFFVWSDEFVYLGMGRALGLLSMFSRVAAGFRVQNYALG
mgnify:FL=1